MVNIKKWEFTLKLDEQNIKSRITQIENLIVDVHDGVEGNDGGDRIDRLEQALVKYRGQLANMKSPNLNDNSAAGEAVAIA